MKLYGRMVEGDQLPTPFNLLQLALWLPFYLLDRLFGVHTSAKIVREFGVGIAWLMLGPPGMDRSAAAATAVVDPASQVAILGRCLVYVGGSFSTSRAKDKR